MLLSQIGNLNISKKCTNVVEETKKLKIRRGIRLKSIEVTFHNRSFISP